MNVFKRLFRLNAVYKRLKTLINGISVMAVTDVHYIDRHSKLNQFGWWYKHIILLNLQTKYIPLHNENIVNKKQQSFNTGVHYQTRNCKFIAYCGAECCGPRN